MRWIVRACVAAGAMLFLVAGLSVSATAQGVTTASVRGSLVDETGAPVEGAAVVLVNASTGQQFQGISRADGRYNIENVAVGGPYTLTARLIGFQAAGRDLFYLGLQQELVLNLEMSRAAVQLEALVVTAQEQDPLTAVSRTGTAAFVSDSAISRLPTLNRNFTDFVSTVPQIASIQDDAPSIGGGHNRQNNVQIDGVSDNDLFGLGSTGQPGGQVDAKSITLEAVKEYQVLIAPFDVRQSGFSGGIINAVTKRGTNRWHGSAFWYYQQNALVRDSLPYNGVVFGEYLQHQRGFSVGGPLLRDRLHFFGAGEWQTRETPSFGPTIGREALSAVRVARDSAERFIDILQDVYGVDAGTYEAFTINQPNRNLFGRLDFQLNNNHALTLRHNYTSASSDLGISRGATSYEFSSAGYIIRNESHSSMLQLNSTFGGKYFNELRIGYLRIRDKRDPLVSYAWLDVDNRSEIGGQTYNNTFFAGAEYYSQRNRLDQDVLELTDDFTFAKGSHTITIGTHNERIAFDNIFFAGSIGSWQFNDLAALEAGTPSVYTAQLPYPGETDSLTAGRADWSIAQLGLYLQDEWDVSPNLKITGGIRVDMPLISDKPRANTDLANSAAMSAHLSALGLDPIHTENMPSGNLHFAPRLGFNWDLTGNRGSVVRGGVGLFTGRPAYVWLSNAFTNTGKDIALLSCSGAAVPAFNETTLFRPPQVCAGGGAPSTPVSQVNYFENDFHFPQQLKASLAIDQRLPGDIIGTVEFLYTKHVNSIYLQEMNIAAEPLFTNAEGRQMFGDPANFSSSYGIMATRIDANFIQVLRHSNRSDDRAYAFTVQLQKRFAQGYEFSAGYTYQDVKDVTSLGSSIATSNYGYSPVSAGENPNQKSLTTSRFDVPHRIVLTGTFDVPIPNVPTSFTFAYVGQSGTPYSWTIDGDANGDGYEGPGLSRRHNDIVYVPNAAGSNFSAYTPEDLDEYQALISNELFPNLMPCLKEVQDAGGGIPERNTCRNPWINRFDASLRMGVGRAIGGTLHKLTLVADVINVLNLLNSDWGVVRAANFFETPYNGLLQLRSYDAANDRGRYSYNGPDVLGPLQDWENQDINPATGLAYTADETKKIIERNVFGAANVASRWRLQLGLRYDF